MLAASVASAAAFNLLCTGQVLLYSTEAPREAGLAAALDAIVNPKPIKPPTAFQAEYRVDLKRGRWCLHDLCDQSFQLDNVTDGELVLAYSADRKGLTITVNRETGAYYRRSDQPDGFTEVRGQCVRRPTPGLPKPKF